MIDAKPICFFDIIYILCQRYAAFRFFFCHGNTSKWFCKLQMIPIILPVTIRHHRHDFVNFILRYLLLFRIILHNTIGSQQTIQIAVYGPRTSQQAKIHTQITELSAAPCGQIAKVFHLFLHSHTIPNRKNQFQMIVAAILVKQIICILL